MRVILPCAGFGTRMGMKPNESKEMLQDPERQGHVIDYALSLCALYGYDPIAITRREKTDLRKYLIQRRLSYADIVPEGEWHQSVLKSKPYWKEHNLLILPDTRFGSWDRIKDIERGLELGNKAVFALHEVKDDPSLWGIVHDYQIVDKPQYHLEGKQWAWGIIGFKKEYGEELFSNLESSKILKDVGFTFLDEFRDITRAKW